MRLSFEFIPRWSAGYNLRTIAGEHEWRKLRRCVLTDGDSRCAICGRRGGLLECHEVFFYDDDAHVMTVADVICLCHLCHAVKHLNLSTSGRSSYTISRSALAAHFCAVNRCSMAEFEDSLAETLAAWNERSAFDWAIDLGKFQCLTWKFPRDAFRVINGFEHSEACDLFCEALDVFNARHPELAPTFEEAPADWAGVINEPGCVGRMLDERERLRETLPVWTLFNRETDSTFYLPLGVFTDIWKIVTWKVWKT